MNYTHLWQRGNIWIFDFFDKSVTNDYQTCLQLSGQGCREMELLLEAQGDHLADLSSKHSLCLRRCSGEAPRYRPR